MSKLYNFSQFATAHAPSQGQKPTGYTLTGYRYDDEDEKTYYCNLYIPADRVKIKRDPHGDGWYMTIKMAEITPKYKNDSADEGKGKKRKPQKPSNNRQDYDDDEDSPF